jgi:P4 family phage/plasmid primase-like protien
MLAKYGDDLRYIEQEGVWMHWQEGAWRVDAYDRVVRALAAVLHVDLYEEARADIENAAYFVKWGRKCQEERTVKATVNLLKNFGQIVVDAGRLDDDPELAGFDGGRQVVNLRTGRIRPADRVDYITKSLGVNEIGDSSKAVRWRLFLEQVFDGDRELIDWIQKLCGYILTGETSEQVLVFAHGFGRNGKSIFGMLLKFILGQYGKSIAPESLTDVKRTGAAASPDLAELGGARLVLSTETENGAALAESLIKLATAGETIPVRKLYCAPIDLEPHFKLLMLGNHKPVIKGTDLAIWARILLVPFLRTFTEDERDPDLLLKLKAEAEHIAAWAIEGAVRWHKERLLKDVPAIIKAATAEYRSDQDLIGRWLEECCVVSDDTQALSNELYQSYQAWNLENGLKALSHVRLSRQLAERGFGHRKSNGKAIWTGLFLPNSPSGFGAIDS